MTNLLNTGAKATIWGKFKKLWMYYILQSLMAAAVLCVLVRILGKDRMVLISSMGATAFILFGFLFYYADLPYILGYPLTLAVAIFFMVALDVEHPPAAGTALAVVINEVSFDVSFITVMLSAVLLSQCRYYLRNYLKDLL